MKASLADLTSVDSLSDLSETSALHSIANTHSGFDLIQPSALNAVTLENFISLFFLCGFLFKLEGFKSFLRRCPCSLSPEQFRIFADYFLGFASCDFITFYFKLKFV